MGGVLPLPHPPGIGAFGTDAWALGRDPSLKVDLVGGGSLEDRGPILGNLGVMISTI